MHQPWSGVPPVEGNDGVQCRRQAVARGGAGTPLVCAAEGGATAAAAGCAFAGTAGAAAGRTTSAAAGGSSAAAAPAAASAGAGAGAAGDRGHCCGTEGARGERIGIGASTVTTGSSTGRWISSTDTGTGSGTGCNAVGDG